MARPPKPTALKLLTGNPGGRKLNDREPEPKVLDDCTPPAYLSEAAREIWAEWAPKLTRNLLLTELDVEAFAQWCISIELARAAYKHVLEHGTVRGRPLLHEDGSPVLDKDGRAVMAGEHLSQHGLALSMWGKRALEIGNKFGLSPRDRVGLSINPQGDLFGAGQGNKAAGYFGAA